MSESEIAQMRETIAREYMAAKWGLTGFAQGTTKHAFISARMERIEEGRKALAVHVGDEAIALIAETIESVPEEPTRYHLQEMLRHELGNTADTEYLLGDLKEVWETFDLLIELFDIEDARKMINASVAEMLAGVSEEPTRHHVQKMLRHELGNTADTERFLDDLKEVWETFDLLIELFGIEDAQKMINASPS